MVWGAIRFLSHFHTFTRPIVFTNLVIFLFFSIALLFFYIRFDPEKLYTSAADRAELLAMNEFEREEMLADRHEVGLCTLFDIVWG